MNKRCPTCKKVKPLEEFNSQGKFCRLCHNAANKKWREENKEKNAESQERYRQKLCVRQKLRLKKARKDYYERHKDRLIARYKAKNKERYIEIQKFILAYLSNHHCVDCGESRPMRLSFDHRGDKKLRIGSSQRWGVSLDDVKKEILKCDVRCFNCHFEKTAKERKNMRWLILSGQVF